MSPDPQTQSLMESESSGGIDRHVIRRAFLTVREGYSADRVVADPVLNARFVDECRARNLTNLPEELNVFLLNARKGGRLAGCARSRQTSFSNEDD